MASVFEGTTHVGNRYSYSLPLISYENLLDVCPVAHSNDMEGHGCHPTLSYQRLPSSFSELRTPFSYTEPTATAKGSCQVLSAHVRQYYAPVYENLQVNDRGNIGLKLGDGMADCCSTSSDPQAPMSFAHSVPQNQEGPLLFSEPLSPLSTCSSLGSEPNRSNTGDSSYNSGGALREENGFKPGLSSESSCGRLKDAVAGVVQTAVDATRFRCSSSGWQGFGGKGKSDEGKVDVKKPITRRNKVTIEEVPDEGDDPDNLDELRAAGCRVVEVLRGEERPILDSNGLLIGFASAVPNGKYWDLVLEEANCTAEDSHNGMRGDLKTQTTRGDFNQYTMGIGAGMGRQVPMDIVKDEANHKLALDMYASRAFQEITKYCVDKLHRCAPKISEYYGETLDQLVEHLNEVNPSRPVHPLPSIHPFAATTFNFGPRTVTKPHRDTKNLACGLCGIFVLGRFDSDRGGCIVLRDLNLVLKAPLGTCVFIPSALVKHYNTAVASSERRYSLTLYSASDIFRYVYNGFATDKEVESRSCTPEFWAQRKEDEKERFATGLRRFSKLSEL